MKYSNNFLISEDTFSASTASSLDDVSSSSSSDLVPSPCNVLPSSFCKTKNSTCVSLLLSLWEYGHSLYEKHAQQQEASESEVKFLFTHCTTSFLSVRETDLGGGATNFMTVYNQEDQPEFISVKKKIHPSRSFQPHTHTKKVKISLGKILFE